MHRYRQGLECEVPCPDPYSKVTELFCLSGDLGYARGKGCDTLLATPKQILCLNHWLKSDFKKKLVLGNKK